MENDQVKLYGFWASPYSCRVIWALKIKGIPYEYVEENLPNKSPMLVQYNPVYKKVPVLVHNNRPICESSVILKYIEQVWPENPMLPSDPYERAQARFWIKFIDDKVLSVWALYRTFGEEQEKAIKETNETLRITEEYLRTQRLDQKFFGGDKINMVDIAFGGIAHWLPIIEKVIDLKILDSQSFPRLDSWILNFKEVPLAKENLPDPDSVFTLLKHAREALMVSRDQGQGRS